MNYLDAVIIVFRPLLWVVICSLPLVFSALSMKDERPEPAIWAAVVQAALILSFYTGVIK